MSNPSIRQKLMQLHAIGEVARFNTLRLKAAMAAGKDIPGLPNISKLLMSNTVRLSRDLGLEIAGGYGMLHAYEPEDRKALDDATGLPFLSGITEMALFAQGPPIYGGTDQVQRNIIGERVLGLPKEPGLRQEHAVQGPAEERLTRARTAAARRTRPGAPSLSHMDA